MTQICPPRAQLPFQDIEIKIHGCLGMGNDQFFYINRVFECIADILTKMRPLSLDVISSVAVANGLQFLGLVDGEHMEAIAQMKWRPSIHE